MPQNDDSSSIAWFLAGVALGAAGALLFAPRTGRETRESLAGAAERGRDYAQRKSGEVAELGREAYDRGRQIADEVREAGKSAISDLMPEKASSETPAS